jgi:hypothetical protein
MRSFVLFTTMVLGLSALSFVSVTEAQHRPEARERPPAPVTNVDPATVKKTVPPAPNVDPATIKKTMAEDVKDMVEVAKEKCPECSPDQAPYHIGMRGGAVNNLPRNESDATRPAAGDPSPGAK